MTPNELRQQADSLKERGMFRRAANVLQLVTAHKEATEAERDAAQAEAARILAKHCQAAAATEREKANARQARRRAAAREAAKVTTGKRGDGLRAAQQQIREARAIREQWKEQRWTA